MVTAVTMESETDGTICPESGVPNRWHCQNCGSRGKPFRSFPVWGDDIWGEVQACKDCGTPLGDGPRV